MVSMEMEWTQGGRIRVSLCGEKVFDNVAAVDLERKRGRKSKVMRDFEGILRGVNESFYYKALVCLVAKEGWGVKEERRKAKRPSFKLSRMWSLNKIRIKRDKGGHSFSWDHCLGVRGDPQGRSISNKACTRTLVSRWVETRGRV